MANITGTNDNDTLNGSNSKDVIVALDGDDIVDGGGNNDTIDSGAGWDTLFGGTGNDVILGGAGRDFIDGGGGNDFIGLADDPRNGAPSGGPGDVIYGDRYNTYVLVGGNVVGQDLTASTQLGDDTIYGTSDADTIWGDNGDNPGGSNVGGHDSIFAGNGADTVYGEGGNDLLSGEGGDDVLFGGDGKDTISGGEGNDWIVGGAAADLLDGGTGDDRFVYSAISDSAANKLDTIAGFESGPNFASGDKIDISALDGPGDTIRWTVTTAGSLAAWYETTVDGVRLLVDVTGDAVADLRVNVTGIAALKHSDILGVINGLNSAPELAAPAAGLLVSASTNAQGEQGNSLSWEPAFSVDGSKVLFWSQADNLAADDENGFSDLFLKDLVTGQVSLVSVNEQGEQANGFSLRAEFSGDSALVAFESTATNLVPGGTNGVPHIFVKNLETGEVTIASTNDGGDEGNGQSFVPAVSADGTKVAFSSMSDNLVEGDANFGLDLFVKNLVTGEVILASAGVGGDQTDFVFFSPAFSPDGTKLVFSSTTDNAGAGDANGFSDVYVKDLETGALTLLSTAMLGGSGNNISLHPVFSPDGSKVAFASFATDLVAGVTAPAAHIYVKDLASGAITLVSADVGGIPGDGVSSRPVFSPDGTKIAFASSSSNLVTGDTNGLIDIFMKDLVTGEVTRVSTSTGGAEGDGFSFFPAFSPDGSAVAFASFASNLVPGDSNATQDLFVKYLGTEGAAGYMFEDGALIAGNLISSGTVRFADADLADTHTVLVTPQGLDYLGTFDAAVTNPSTGDGAGAVTWDFSVPNADVQFLAEGETLTQQYLVTITDNHGASVEQLVAIAINGADELLEGTPGNDILVGGTGDDTFVGGAGADTMTGDTGSDTFVFQAADGSDVDTITDFEVGLGADVLDISDVLDGSGATLATLDDYLDLADNGIDTVVSIDPDADGAGAAQPLVTLAGVTGVALGDLMDNNQILL